MKREQLTPHSFGLLLRALRVNADLEIEHLAKILSETPGRFRPKRDVGKPIGATTINRLEHCETDAYWLMERYAAWSGYPTGLLYLLSRLSKLICDSDLSDLEALIQFLRILAKRIEKQSQPLTEILGPDFSSTSMLADSDARVKKSLRDYRRRDPKNPSSPYQSSATQRDDGRQMATTLRLLDLIGPLPWSNSERNWFVLTGAPYAGKSATLQALKKRGYQTVRETARQYIDHEIDAGKTLKQIRLEVGGEQTFQRVVLYLKQAVEQTVADKFSPAEVVFFDRAMPDSIAYYAVCGLDERKLMPFLATRSRYKGVFLLDRLPYKKGGRRTETDAECATLHTNLSRAYHKLGYNVTTVPLMGDKIEGPERRATFILELCGLPARKEGA
jgi:predicted ATPase